MADQTPPPNNAQKLGNCVHGHENPDGIYGFVNIPPFRGSTTLAPTVEKLAANDMPFTYGRRGNPNSQQFINILKKLERSDAVVLTSSGLSAISTALMSLLTAGDHVILADTVYYPTRHFCNQTLKRFNIEHTFVDTTDADNVKSAIQKNTSAIFLESPGSGTFEIEDNEGIVALARSKNITTLIDNTWATPLHFTPHDWGIDISIQAVTKYIGGHADVNMGYVSAIGKRATELEKYYGDSGFCVSTDDIFLAMRGLRSLPVRLKQHADTAIHLAAWLEQRPEIKRVLYPPLPSSPEHERYKTYFTGAAGLFSVEFQEHYSQEEVFRALNALNHFGYGYSWGGFESLVIPVKLTGSRTASQPRITGQLARFQIGLEDADVLKQDIEAALTQL